MLLIDIILRFRFAVMIKIVFCESICLWSFVHHNSIRLYYHSILQTVCRLIECLRIKALSMAQIFRCRLFRHAISTSIVNRIRLCLRDLFDIRQITKVCQFLDFFCFFIEIQFLRLRQIFKVFFSKVDRLRLRHSFCIEHGAFRYVRNVSCRVQTVKECIILVLQWCIVNRSFVNRFRHRFLLIDWCSSGMQIFLAHHNCVIV